MSWGTGKVSDIADIVSGFAFKSSWFGSGFSKIIRIGDLQNGLINHDETVVFDQNFHNVSNQFKIKENDILMALSGATVGKIAIATSKDEECYLNQRVAIIRGKNKTNSDYLKYVFSGSLLNKLLLSAGGAAQPNLSPKKLADMEILLPPLEEQKRIAAILDKADAIRRKRQQAIQLADEYLRSVFLDMFGDPVTNPKGWKQRKLNNEFDIQHGYAFKSENFLSKGDYILLTPGNFFEKGGFRDRGDKQKYHNPPVPEEYILKKGDILIAMTEQAPGLLGSPIIVPESHKFLHNQRLGKIQKKTDIETLFICHLMNISSIRNRIQKDSTGTKVKHTSPKKIGDIKVGIPPLDLQQKFAKQVQKVEALKTKLNASLDQADQQFKALSQRAFAGEL